MKIDTLLSELSWKQPDSKQNRAIEQLITIDDREMVKLVQTIW